MVLLSILCLLLGGCRVILVDDSIENPDSKYKLDAKVYIKRATILIRSETTLPPETELEISILPYSDQQPRGKIQGYQVEPEDKSVISTTATVGNKGKVDPIVLNRPDPSKRYRIEIAVSKENGTEEFAEASFARYINLMKIEDPDGIGANLAFLSMSEIKELFQTPLRSAQSN
ncbi:hypothetical protein D3H55_20510 [Bacillus salacetis]|uniref:Uncharacterized protein n=1 Tax=Bacillus salacetis TaxID=2315464 RepID=A0A3A1QUC6_9BACI|nr:hypothetical protein D3H55_20510 [Bacillus salacetis]